MTDRELMQQALDALQECVGVIGEPLDVIETLRARLAQPEPEPVCEQCKGLGYYDEGHENDDGTMSGGDYVECDKCKAQPELNPWVQCTTADNKCLGGCRTRAEHDRYNKQPEPNPVAAGMTAERAAYFMRRFKHEEKLLGPNEQAALNFVITMLDAPPRSEPVIDKTMAIRIATQLGWEPKREWVGLTDDEIEDACWTEVDQRLLSFARAIEAKLKEKNNG